MIPNILIKLFLFFLNPSSRANWLRRLGMKIGNNCQIYRDTSFGSESYLITIGNNVRITDGVRFVNHDGGVWIFRKDKNFADIDVIKPISVGSNVHIGINSIIMPGISIGDNVVIGAGSVVTKNIPSNSIAAGVPARIIKSYDEYLTKTILDSHSTKKMRSKEKKNYYISLFNR